MSDQRPQSFTVEYNAGTLTFERLPDGNGYGYRCPLHPDKPFHWIDTESGKMHALTFDEQGRATVKGSLGHASFNCSWHVVITDGIARDV